MGLVSVIYDDIKEFSTNLVRWCRLNLQTLLCVVAAAALSAIAHGIDVGDIHLPAIAIPYAPIIVAMLVGLSNRIRMSEDVPHVEIPRPASFGDNRPEGGAI